MPELILDLLLPETARGVLIQWLIMVPFWLVVIAVSLRWSKDARTFVYGLAMVNLAWFAARTVH